MVQTLFCVKNAAYYRAITKHVHTDDVVLDVGTGTGILSFFAASKNPRKIYAIDHSDIIKTARLIARLNGIHGIEFIKCNSRRFESPEPLDIIIHEQISFDLFSENMLPTLLDLRRRVLKPDGMILPGKFDLYIEPTKLKDDYRLPFIWEQEIYGIRFDGLRHMMERAFSKQYYRRIITPSEIEYLLSAPEKLLSFDLHTVDSGDLPKTVTFKRIVAQAGRLDGFCMYFNVRFDEEIWFSTSPASRRTHWDILLFRTPARHYREGDEIELELTMDPIDAPSAWELRHS